MSEPLGIAVCRRASERPIKPGTVEGYACEICKVPLRLTVASARQVTAGELVACCNACGVILSVRLETAGHELDVIATPAALAQLADRPAFDPLTNFFRARLTECAHCGAAIRNAEEAKTHTCRAKGSL